MVPRRSLLIRILAGGYITYLGGKLLISSIKEQPENYILYVAAGIVFIIIGLIWLVRSGTKLVKKEYEDDSVMGQLNKNEDEDGQTEEAAGEEATEEAAVEEKAAVSEETDEIKKENE